MRIAAGFLTALCVALGIAPIPELTYTATGFSNPVRVTFNAIFNPTELEDSSEMVGQHFRMVIRRQMKEVHVLDRWFYRPIHSTATWLAAALARMHHGRVNAYVGYVLLALILVLIFLRGLTGAVGPGALCPQ
jgi:hydrogenase-4 component B